MANIKNYNQNFKGCVGNIDSLVDCPLHYDRVAIVCHPNPMFGGTNLNKVSATIARTLNQHNFCTIRPNFRGVGKSEGEHTEGVGETEDILLLIDQVIKAYPSYHPITLCGFSFGAFVMSRVIQTLQANKTPIEFMILAGVALGLFDCGLVCGRPLVIHGEKDDVIPMDRVFRWAELQDHPVVIVPGADHFFSKKLHILKRVISRFIAKKAKKL